MFILILFSLFCFSFFSPSAAYQQHCSRGQTNRVMFQAAGIYSSGHNKETMSESGNYILWGHIRPDSVEDLGMVTSQCGYDPIFVPLKRSLLSHRLAKCGWNKFFHNFFLTWNWGSVYVEWAWAERKPANLHLLPFTGKITYSRNGAPLKELSLLEQARLWFTY